MRLKLFMPCILMLLLSEQSMNLFSQSLKIPIDTLLAQKVKDIPALDEKVNISVSNVSLDEFLRAVANSAALNIDVQPGLEYTVVNNFVNVKVRDMLVFLCKQFNLQLWITGNIISIYKIPEPTKVQKSVMWDTAKKVVTFDFSNTPLEQVTREIIRETKVNIVLSPELTGKTVSFYIESSPLKNALDKLAYANGMELNQTSDNFYLLEPQKQLNDQRNMNQDRTQRRGNDQKRSEGFVLNIDTLTRDTINFYSEDAPIAIVLKELSEKTGMNYFISPKVDETVSMQLQRKSLDEVLNNLFNGTQISYKFLNGIYIFGEKNMFDFNEHKVIQLQNRSIDKILPLLPEDITKNLTIKEFPELNSLFVTGTAYQVAEFERFINEIDKVVPVVMIEVIILDVNKSISTSTGLAAGIGKQQWESNQTIFPGIDLSLNSGQINKVLDEIGWVNLGKVTPNFYIELKALESQEQIKIESTPKLATLNGHEATLTIGNTEYYEETQTNIYGTLTSQTTSSISYKPMNADLTVKIKPVVSADEQITLDIDVKQSQFTKRVTSSNGTAGPYGSQNRSFTSQVRVKNQEMVLLGGLVQKNIDDSGSGLPLLSHIPILKWFFSNRTKSNSDSKLDILIRPTIIN